MPNRTEARFVVVGAGLVGSMTAAMLGREGFSVDVVERRGDPRVGRMDGGRSINLAISARGINALSRLGLDADIEALGIPLYRRAMHATDGTLSYQPYGVGKQAIYSFSRAELNRALVRVAGEGDNVTFRFGRRCVDIDIGEGAVAHVDANNAADSQVSRGVIVGADGAYSVVRAVMRKREFQDYSQSYLAHGYKELFIPAGLDGAAVIEQNAMHIWPRGRFMMMAMANPEGSFTVTLYLPMTGENGFDRLRTPEDVLEFFGHQFPDAVPLMPTLTEDFFANPTGAMVTVRTYPWQVAGTAVLIGDAAHAVVPFYGQGANAGFEDCLELVEQIRRLPNDLTGAFEAYQAIRKPNTDAIADLALANFAEMRDHVASARFRFRKRLEQVLHLAFPRWFVPLYSMIAFSLVPYAAARARAARQARVVKYLGWGLGLVLGLVLLATVLR